MSADFLLQGLQLYSLDIPTWMTCSYLKPYSSRTRCFMFPVAPLSTWRWQHLPLSCQSPKPHRELRSHLPPQSPRCTRHLILGPLFSTPALQALGTTGLDLGSYPVTRLTASVSLSPTPASWQRFSTHGFLNQTYDA